MFRVVDWCGFLDGIQASFHLLEFVYLLDSNYLITTLVLMALTLQNSSAVNRILSFEHVSFHFDMRHLLV